MIFQQLLRQNSEQPKEAISRMATAAAANSTNGCGCGDNSTNIKNYLQHKGKPARSLVEWSDSGMKTKLKFLL